MSMTDTTALGLAALAVLNAEILTLNTAQTAYEAEILTRVIPTT